MTTKPPARPLKCDSIHFCPQDILMKKTILTFGLISGVISSILMLCTAPFLEKVGDKGALIGYTCIIASFLLVFFGIRSYRDNVGHGYISFKDAFLIGISITVISCVFYVLTWEVLYFTVFPDFMDKYAARVLEKLKSTGASQATIDAQVQQLKKYKQLYANPFFNFLMTFIEPFPVGLLITLLSSAILRTKPPVPTPSSLPATS